MTFEALGDSSPLLLSLPFASPTIVKFFDGDVQYLVAVLLHILVVAQKRDMMGSSNGHALNI